MACNLNTCGVAIAGQLSNRLGFQTVALKRMNEGGGAPNAACAVLFSEYCGAQLGVGTNGHIVEIMSLFMLAVQMD